MNHDNRPVRIGITGGVATGTTWFLEELRKRLLWPNTRSAGESVRSIQLLYPQLRDKTPAQFLAVMPGIDQIIDNVNRDFVSKHPRCILEARLIHPALKDLPGAFPVLVKCDMEIRVKRESERAKVTPTVARERIIDRDYLDNERFKKLYGTKKAFDDYAEYLLVLDSSSDSPEVMVKRLFFAIKFRLGIDLEATKLTQ